MGLAKKYRQRYIGCMRAKHTVRSLVEALGGQAVVAEMFGLTRSAVWVWCRDGVMPAYTFPEMQLIAAAHGIIIDETLFRMSRKPGSGFRNATGSR